MNQPRKKAQAAIEFLSTYAWAFVVILITLGALYYFGIFDFSRYIPQKCAFSPQFACADFTLGQSRISARIANTLGEDINITSAKITDDFASPLTCTDPVVFPDDLSWPPGVTLDLNFTSCSGGGLIAGELLEARIRFTYFAVNSPTKTEHSVSGKLSGKVLSS